jgi:hypothetical protein
MLDEECDSVVLLSQVGWRMLSFTHASRVPAVAGTAVVSPMDFVYGRDTTIECRGTLKPVNRYGPIAVRAITYPTRPTVPSFMTFT